MPVYRRRRTCIPVRRKTTRRRTGSKTRTRRGTSLVAQVKRNTRALRDVVARDYYRLEGTSNLPQNGIYPYFVSLIDPFSWIRVFDQFGTTDLEEKSKVRLMHMRMKLRFSLEGAGDTESFKITAFLVGLHKAAKIVFPAGLSNSGFVVDLTHLSNDTNNQVMLNPEIFKTYKSWEFQIGDRADGATFDTSTYTSSYRNFNYSKALSLPLASTFEAWKQLNSVDLAISSAMYLMVFATCTDNKATPPVFPQMQFQCQFKIRSAN